MKHLLTALAACAAASGALAQLPPPSITLAPSPAGGVQDGFFGIRCLLNDRYAVVGEPGRRVAGAPVGGVHVFNPRTGRRLRVITPPDPQPNEAFGRRMALCGDLALISSGLEDRGVFLYNLRTGRLVRVLGRETVPDNLGLGWALALTPEVAFVSHVGHDQFRGRVIVYDLKTGNPLRELTAGEDIPGLEFGYSLAVEGDFLMVGGAGDQAAQLGAVYVFNWRTGERLRVLRGDDSAHPDRLGLELAVSGPRLYASAATAADEGCVYAFDWVLGQQLFKLTAPEFTSGQQFAKGLAAEGRLLVVGHPGQGFESGQARFYHGGTGQPLAVGPWGTRIESFEAAESQFGFSVALFADRLLVGSFGEELTGDSAPASGAARIFRGLEQPLSMTSLLGTGTEADGGGDFRAFADAWVNSSGACLATGTLRSAIPASTSSGAWFTRPNEAAALVTRRNFSRLGNDGGTPRISAIRLPVANHPVHFSLMALTFSGGPAHLRQGIYQATLNNALLVPALPAGHAFPELGGAFVENYLDLADPGFINSPTFAARYRLSRAGGAGVSARNDSGILIGDFRDFVGAAVSLGDNSAREGELAFNGDNFGEISPRAAHNWIDYSFSSAMVSSVPGPGGSPEVYRALWRSTPAGTQNLVARQGLFAAGAGAASYRSFLGVTLQRQGVQERAIWRAMLAGGGSSVRNNEGIWHETTGLVARKGNLVPNEPPSTVWNRFLGFWPAGEGRVVVFARVSGPGVNAGNDLGVWLVEEDGQVRRLLREGETLGLPDGPRVRVISRVDVEKGGRFVILASLTGAAGHNQALFANDSGLADRPLRSARIALRKGWPLRSPSFFGQIPSLLGMRLSQSLDADGAGGRGRGQVINQDGQVSALLRFDKKELLVLGQP